MIANERLRDRAAKQEGMRNGVCLGVALRRGCEPRSAVADWDPLGEASERGVVVDWALACRPRSETVFNAA
jgi:hypothetical protein